MEDNIRDECYTTVPSLLGQGPQLTLGLQKELNGYGGNGAEYQFS
jgi:hypothetical protein